MEKSYKMQQILFHAVIIFGLGSDFSFQSILEHFGNNFVLLVITFCNKKRMIVSVQNAENTIENN